MRSARTGQDHQRLSAGSPDPAWWILDALSRRQREAQSAWRGCRRNQVRNPNTKSPNARRAEAAGKQSTAEARPTQSSSAEQGPPRRSRCCGFPGPFLWTSPRDGHGIKASGPDFRPALPLRTSTEIVSPSDAAPQTHANSHTRNTALLHRNDGNSLSDTASPASHQFWGQAQKNRNPKSEDRKQNRFTGAGTWPRPRCGFAPGVFRKSAGCRYARFRS